MFSGEFKSKRPINLGKKATQDRKQLLQKAQIQREQREYQKSQVKAVQSIQRAWKTYSIKKEYIQKQRQDFDDKILFISESISFFQLGMLLCHFYSPALDMSRLSRYLESLLEREWLVEMPVFLVVKLNSLMMNSFLFQIPMAPFFLQAVALHPQKIVPKSLNAGILKLIVDEFTGSSLSKSTCQSLLSGLLSVTGPSMEWHSKFVLEFTRHFLCNDSMSTILGKETISTYIPNILQVLHSIDHLEDWIPIKEIPILLHRLIDYADSGQNVYQWMTLISNLLTLIPKREEEFGDYQEDDSEEDESLENAPFSISFLIDSLLFLDVLQLFDSIEYRPHLSGLLVYLMYKWPREQELVLNRLLYKTRISWIPLLSHSLSSSPLCSRCQSDPIWISLLLGEFSYEEWSMYILYCVIFTRQSLTMTDLEFLKSEQKEWTLTMSTVIKNMVFGLFWADKIPLYPFTRDISLEFMRNVFVKFLNQVYMRDCRKSFCPSNHWHISHSSDLQQITALLEMPLLDPLSLDSQGHSFRQSKSLAAQKILEFIPFVIPFNTRVELFRTFINRDRASASSSGPIRATIKRTHMFEDGFAQLNAHGPHLKGRVAITFISEHGLEEAGIDGGGVFKEFLTGLAKQAFDPDYGLFVATKEEFIYPCPHSFATQEPQLSYFEFLGRVIGKALYEGVLLDVAFADFFLAKWCQKQNFLEDLSSLDPDLYQGLLFLKGYQGNVEKDLSLNFTMNELEFGESKTFDLIPGGSNIPVTNENRIQYIYLASHYRVNLRIQKQCQAFFKGLKDLIEPLWLKMFHQQELQLLLGGTSIPIDLQDLQLHCEYSGGFDANHPTIIMLWEILSEFSQQDLKAFIRFVTSCPRPPLLGFKALVPKFCIRNAGSQDLTRLPTASTCVNLLKMPCYQDKEMMKSKLSYSIHFGAGFDLS